MDFFDLGDSKQYICGVYVRVSSDMQDSSITNQQEYFNEYIKRMGFTLYKFYIDEALTGTESSKRLSWQTLIQDGINGKYNTLLAKSYSRFGRNQQQTLSAISELIKHNIRIIFIEDGLDSKKDYNNFGLFAWLAEQEARKTSERIKMTWDLYNQQGKIHVCISNYGYDYDKDTKTFVINPEEAEVVKRIFSMYVDKGYGFTKIANILQQEGVKSKKGGQWAGITISGILRNPIYIGTLIQGKSRNIDITIKKRKKIDKDKWYIHENRVEPIISKELFDKAQSIMQERKNKSTYQRHSTASLFSNLIKCACCGSSFTIKRQKHFYNYRPYYSCINYELKGKTLAGHSRNFIYEDVLIEIIKDYFIEIKNNNYELFKKIDDENNKKQEKKPNYQKELNKIEKKINEVNNQSMTLLKLLTEKIINTTQYKLQNEQLSIQLEKLIKEKDYLLLKIQEEENKETKKEDVKNIVEQLIETDTSLWTNALLKKCISSITIDLNNNITIDMNVD